MIVLLGAILVLLIWWYARALYGPSAGLAAAALAAGFCLGLALLSKFTAWLLEQEPVARIGHSIWIFRPRPPVAPAAAPAP
jgi:hypothetical protein